MIDDISHLNIYYLKDIIMDYDISFLNQFFLPTQKLTEYYISVDNILYYYI